MLSAQIERVVNELVHHSLPSSKNASRIEVCRQDALCTVNSTRPSRVNQFEVDARLAGLEEKFRIVNNDELANALRHRLDELSDRLTTWTPEVLSLFLQLSNRPAQNSSIEDLDDLQVKSEHVPLTWSQIIQEDPLDNRDGLWNDIDYIANESEDDIVAELKRSSTPGSTSSSTDSHYLADHISGLTIAAQGFDLCDIKSSRFWQALNDVPAEDRQVTRIEITESQMIRESLFMLHGLPTSIYVLCENDQILFSRRYYTARASDMALIHLLGDFANIGTHLSVVRAWTRRAEPLPLQQTIQAALAVRMAEIDQKLALLETSVLDNSGTLTLLSIVHSISQFTRPIQQVAMLLQSFRKIELQFPFTVLESLYDVTCLSQCTGDKGSYIYLAKLFLECFLTYLKPVQLWMESGELTQWRESFFISKNEDTVSAESFWHDQFRLDHTNDGKLRAPKFLHCSALKILNTGKTVNFRRKLGRGASASQAQSDGDGSDFFLDFQDDPETLRPFAEIFEVALDDWINLKYQLSCVRLRHEILSQCGLQRFLDALEYIYFCRDGSLTDQAVFAIFDRLDRGHEIWNDPFRLSGVFRDSFSVLTCIDAQRITVRLHGNELPKQGKSETINALGYFSIHYPPTWSVANILRPKNLVIYQRISTFLIQLRRATYVLERRVGTQIIGSVPNRPARRLAMLVRHRLLWFINLISAYLNNVVLSTTTSRMRLALHTAGDVDKMVAVYQAYVVRLEDQCLLSEKLEPVHRAIIALLNLAVSLLATPPSSLTDSDDQEEHPRSHEQLQQLGSDLQISQLNHLKTLNHTYERLHDFVVAGLRAVRRVGTEPCWEVLADLLDHRSGQNGRYSEVG